MDPHKHMQRRTDELFVDIPISQDLEESAGVLRLFSQERVQRVVEHVVDVPVPQQVLKDTVGLVGLDPQEIAKRLWRVFVFRAGRRLSPRITGWRGKSCIPGADSAHRCKGNEANLSCRLQCRAPGSRYHRGQKIAKLKLLHFELIFAS